MPFAKRAVNAASRSGGFGSHLIRDTADYARHVEYCYINPLKHRLVGRVRDWPYASFHRDVRAGLFPED
jgi:putative transposase